MLNMVNRDPAPAELRSFGVTVLVGLLVIGALVWWWRGDDARWIVWFIWAVGGIAGLLTLAAPPGVGRRVYVGWMLAAAAIGAVMIPLFMTVLFVLVLPLFTPVRFKDPLRLGLRRNGSYWEPHEPHEPTIERMLRPF